MTTKTLLTLAEFERMPLEDGLRYELDAGELVAMTFPNPRHNDVAGEIYTQLKVVVRSRSLGHVYPSDTGYILGRHPDTLRGPDVSFIRRERMAQIDEERSIEGAPDLAVEVVSPSDTARDLNRKVQQYLRAVVDFRKALQKIGEAVMGWRDVAAHGDIAIAKFTGTDIVGLAR